MTPKNQTKPICTLESLDNLASNVSDPVTLDTVRGEGE